RTLQSQDGGGKPLRVSWRHGLAAGTLAQQRGDLSVLITDEDGRPSRRKYAVEFAGHNTVFQRRQKRDDVQIGRTQALREYCARVEGLEDDVSEPAPGRLFPHRRVLLSLTDEQEADVGMILQPFGGPN